MPLASIGGLVSGLDTATIISQLMQIEARPQSMLKERVSDAERALNALQTTNSKLAGIVTKAAELSELADWSSMTASSSNEGVTVDAADTATLTSLSFDIVQTGTSARATYALTGTVDQTVVAANTTLTITHDDGTVAAFDTGDGTLADIVAGINDPAADTGLSASLIKVGVDPVSGKNTYQLHVVSKSGGTDSGFTIGNASFLDGVVTGSKVIYTTGETGLGDFTGGAYQLQVGGSTYDFSVGSAPSFADIKAAIDATGAPVTVEVVDTGTEDRLQITSTDGSPLDIVPTAGAPAFLGGVHSTHAGRDAIISLHGQELTADGNTFEELMPGVDVTLAADAEGSATISIEKDAADLAGRVESLVSALNSVLDDIESLTAYGVDGATPGLLEGDSTLRSVRTRLLDAFVGGIGGESLAGVGIETTREGKLEFDAEKFKEALAADPNGTAAMFAAPEGYDPDNPDPAAVVGIAAQMEQIADLFSDSIDGTITLSIKSRESQISGWEDKIADWDNRLELRRTALERQYTALEVSLGKLQQQGSWLAGQIAGLPSWSSGQ